MIDAIQISAWLDQSQADQPQAAEWETADSQLASPGKKLMLRKTLVMCQLTLSYGGDPVRESF